MFEFDSSKCSTANHKLLIANSRHIDNQWQQVPSQGTMWIQWTLLKPYVNISENAVVSIFEYSSTQFRCNGYFLQNTDLNQ